MPHKLFSNANLHTALNSLDAEIATVFQEASCQHCKSRLDVSHDPRKLHGVPDTFRQLCAIFRSDPVCCRSTRVDCSA